MSKKTAKPNNEATKPNPGEPSEDDLLLIEDNPEDLIELDGEDLDALLQDVLTDPGDTAKIEAVLKGEDELALLDFDNGDDKEDDINIDTDTPSDDTTQTNSEENLFEEKDIEEKDSDETDEENFVEFDEYADDNDIGDDSNFDGDQMDHRFPEY